MTPLLVVLHGVNLGLLGERPAAHYGSITLPELERLVSRTAADRGWTTHCHQTNHEGTFVELAHQYREADGMIVNPGAWTHYSWAIHDALELVRCPIVEVHLSAVESRESWRQVSVVADVAAHRVTGKGAHGYVEAVHWLSDHRHQSACPGGDE